MFSGKNFLCFSRKFEFCICFVRGARVGEAQYSQDQERWRGGFTIIYLLFYCVTYVSWGRDKKRFNLCCGKNKCLGSFSGQEIVKLRFISSTETLIAVLGKMSPSQNKGIEFLVFVFIVSILNCFGLQHGGEVLVTDLNCTSQ